MAWCARDHTPAPAGGDAPAHLIARALLLVGTLVVFAIWTSDARPQSPGKVHRIGVLAVGDQSRLRDALREFGYVEGRNVAYDNRDTAGRAQPDEFAAELVRSKVDVIVATYPGAVLAAKRATSTIPIVMVNTPDPVQLGIVPALARPGHNITGTTSLSVDVSVKQLQLLKEAVPTVSRVAVLWNPDSPWHSHVVRGLRDSTSFAVQVQMLAVQRPEHIEEAFKSMIASKVDGLLVLADPMTMAPANRSRIAKLAIRQGIPSIGGLRGYADAGGLMSYWADENELYRRVASYIDRILKGAPPGSLPIEQPKTYDLIINETTAKALGRALPGSLLSAAKELVK